ncbi:MAG: hypothetical protein MJD61_08460 [Proteobacteria bacterium]|nr:hypothetical protein [Pseudomonadota bacterium]
MKLLGKGRLLEAWTLAGVLALGSLAFGSSALINKAQAETPDVRNIKSVMMLVVDTSGSMERVAGCTCTSPSCVECEPDCSANQKNRWATALEALTGSYTSFSCTEKARTAANGMTYDIGYFIPHHDPPGSGQNSDGILDSYSGQVKFGLMTFDGMATWYGESPMVTEASWSDSDSASEEGMWSYAGAKTFKYPGCTTDYKMDTGARDSSGDEGKLISVGSDSDDLATINSNIQSTLLSVRPFSGTPIAAALDDVYYYFENHAHVKSGSDAYYGCRKRYALLLTDGVPDPDYRDLGCNTPGYSCPYPLADDAAAYLRCGSGTTSCSSSTGPLEKLFVIGFSAADQSVRDTLDSLASNGGSDQALFADNLSELRSALATTLDQGVHETTSRSTPAFANSVSGAAAMQQFQVNAGFVVGSGSDPWQGFLERRRFVCSGTSISEPSLSSEDRFHEVLNNRSTSRNLWTVKPAGYSQDAHMWKGLTTAPCGTSGCSNVDFTNSNIAPQNLGLNSWETSRRNTIVNWVHANSSSNRSDKKLGDIYHSSPVAVGPPQFDSADHSYNLFRRKLAVRSRPHTLYVGSNDGILHAFALDSYPVDSSDTAHTSTTYNPGEEMWGFVPPLVMAKLDAAVDSHQFLADGTPVVKDVYFSRTPGSTPSPDDYHSVLVTGLRGGGKGFVALDVTDPVDPKFLWQFTHTFTEPCYECDTDFSEELDEGTGCGGGGEEDNRCSEDDNDEDDEEGEEGGGGPCPGNGERSYLGLTYGQPALAQVLVNYNSTIQERAVAILPGGLGELESSSSCNTYRAGTSVWQSHSSIDRETDTYGSLTNHRSQARCWKDDGRSVYIVDVETGTVLKHIDERVFTAPLSGSVSVFPGEVGTVATRAFVTDQDGIVWRIDLTGSDPVKTDPTLGWTARPFHDIYYNAAWNAGYPTYERPAISVDSRGRAVVVVGTGDTDDLATTKAHRVVSLTERLDLNADGTIDLNDTRAAINWTKTLASGESVTGPVELFDGNVYFSTFKSTTGGSSCDFGQSYVYAYDFIDDDSSSPPGPVATAGVGGLVGSAHTNKLFMGVGITKRPQCFDTTTISDPYLGGNRAAIPTAAASNFELVLNAGGDSSADKGGVIKTESMSLPTPASVTKIQSIAGSVD